MKKMTFRFLLLSCLLFLPGCWDIKDIEETNYVTATGIDYLPKEKEYSIYAQTLNFTYLSKVEGKSSSGKKSAFVGHATSPSLELAYTNLYRTAQWRTSWAHTSTLLLSEKAIKEQGGMFFWDLFTRHPDFRLSMFVFGTKEPLDKMMLLEPLYGASPRQAMLRDPEKIYRQLSEIRPIIMFDYGRQMTEPAQTVLLPSVGMDKDAWRDKDNLSPKPFINGAYVFYKQSCTGWLGLMDLKGLRWVQEKSANNSLVLKGGDSSFQTAILLKNLRERIIPLLNEDIPKYDIEVKLTGILIEMHDKMPIKEIEELAAKQVEQEIRETFLRGISIDADVYNLEHFFYKQHTKQWAHTSDTGRKVREDSLRQVRVTVNIQSTGMNK